jgi:hypothetical protein
MNRRGEIIETISKNREDQDKNVNKKDVDKDQVQEKIIDKAQVQYTIINFE